MADKFKVKFRMDNAAFEDDALAETVRILRHIADTVESDGLTDTFGLWPVRDINGNTIGQWGWTRDE